MKKGRCVLFKFKKKHNRMNRRKERRVEIHSSGVIYVYNKNGRKSTYKSKAKWYEIEK
jgi:hypothetical protein